MSIFVRVDIGQLHLAGPTKRVIGETHLSMIATMSVIADCIPGWLHPIWMVLGKSRVHSSDGIMSAMRTMSTKQTMHIYSHN